jgi:hypothetical protein
LIRTPNEVLQKRAYLLLTKYIANRVQDLSVKLEFTETIGKFFICNHERNILKLTCIVEEEAHADIDRAIFDVILNPPDLSGWQSIGIEEHTIHEVLGYLLTWMLMFDHFTDIVSIKID